MRTEYQISESTPVTSRENGALHEMVTELALLVSLKFNGADNRPVNNVVSLHHSIILKVNSTL
ncbi:hypothetical protein GBAR_LOCUS5343, partial [Geodia barretti]